MINGGGFIARSIHVGGLAPAIEAAVGSASGAVACRLKTTPAVPSVPCTLAVHGGEGQSDLRVSRVHVRLYAVSSSPAPASIAVASQARQVETAAVTTAAAPGRKCNHCSLPFSAVRLERTCIECKLQNCHFCSDLYRLESLMGEREPRTLCMNCIPAIKRKILPLIKTGTPDNQQRAKREAAQLDMVLRGNLTHFVDYEQDFTKAELQTVEKGKVKCKECDFKFSLYRAPRKCAQCQSIVCQIDSYDVRISNNLIGIGPTFCCTCWEDVRKRMLEEAARNPSIADDVREVVADADDALLNRDAASTLRHRLEVEGVKESTLKKKGCPLCNQPFSTFRNPDRCQQCARVVCADLSCSGQFFVPKVSVDRPVTMCSDCVGAVAVAAPPRGSVAFGGLNNRKKRELVQSGKECRICRSSFTFFLRPTDCARCNQPSCRRDIVTGIVCPTLSLDAATLCRLCLPDAKAEAQAKARSGSPVEAAEAVRDVEVLTAALAKLGSAGGGVPVTSSSSLVSPRGGGSGSMQRKETITGTQTVAPAVVVAVPAAAVQTTTAPPAATVVDACQLCSNQYSILRKQKQCSECTRNTCGQCVGLFFLKSLGEAKARYICLECLPRIRLALEAAEKQQSGESGVPRSAKEAAAVGISYAGNMFPAVSQTDFSKEETAAIVKGQTPCGHCHEAFSLAYPPFRCSECKMAVCGGCCFHFRLLHFFLSKTRPASLCRGCWPTVSETVTRFADSNPTYWREVQDILVQGNFFLQHSKKAERVALTLPPAADATALSKQACKMCAKKFGVFRVPCLCANCGGLVCPGVACSGLLYVPGKSKTRSVVICSLCMGSAGWERPPIGELPPAMELTTDQARAIDESPSLSCHSCSKALTFLNPPFRCGLSDGWVCRTCSRGRLTHNDQTHPNVCKTCLGRVRGNSPALQLIRAHPGDEEVPADPLPRKASQGDACFICLKKYSAFRKHQVCTQCSSGVCSR
jgi:hypothetical protein